MIKTSIQINIIILNQKSKIMDRQSTESKSEETKKETNERTWKVESKTGGKPTYYKFCKICGQWL